MNNVNPNDVDGGKVLDISKFTESNNSLYKSFFKDKEIVQGWINMGHIYQTKWRNKLSKNSFSLKAPKDYSTAIPQILINRFNLQKNEELFINKYQEAISGDGQEWTRITTLHSSSLLALLCFYNITTENPITINGYIFTESFFEVKTHVFDDSESNMDVVLRGTDPSDNKVLLFLECKFSEYLNCGKYKDISYAYKKYYDKLGLFENGIKGLRFEEEGDNKSITILPEEGVSVYCGGIKQMISHYIGVTNYVRNSSEVAEHRGYKHKDVDKIFLGEIVFKFDQYNIANSATKLENYQSAYKDLAKRINESRDDKLKEKFSMFGDDILTYQDIFHDNSTVLDENVKGLYGL